MSFRLILSPDRRRRLDPSAWALRLVLLAAVAVTGAVPAAARDVRLGGSKSAPEAVTPNLPANVVELPVIVVALRKDDGGWHHIRVSAWLAPADAGTARDMDTLKTSIARNARNGFPGPRGYETLRLPREGEDAAKEILRAAAERSLGHPWTGDVLIRSLLVY